MTQPEKQNQQEIHSEELIARYLLLQSRGLGKLEVHGAGHWAEQAETSYRS